MFCPEQQVLDKWYKRVGLEPVGNKGKMKAIPVRRFGKNATKKATFLQRRKAAPQGPSNTNRKDVLRPCRFPSLALPSSGSKGCRMSEFDPALSKTTPSDKREYSAAMTACQEIRKILHKQPENII